MEEKKKTGEELVALFEDAVRAFQKDSYNMEWHALWKETKKELLSYIKELEEKK